MPKDKSRRQNQPSMKEFKSALSALVAAVVIFVLLGQTGRPGQLGAGRDQDRWAHLGAMNDMKVVQGDLNRVAGAIVDEI